MILYVGGSTNATAITGPATYTARYTGNYHQQPYEKLQTTAAATGVLTGTQAGSAVSAGITIALRPAKMTASTAALTGNARLHHDWTIIVNPATTGYSSLGLQWADRGMSTTGASGILSSTMETTTLRSHVAFSVSLAPSTAPPVTTVAQRRVGTAIVDTELTESAAKTAWLRSKFDSLTPRWQSKDAPMAGDGGAALRRILSFGLPVRLHPAIWWGGTETRASTLAITSRTTMKTAIEARITELVNIAKPYNLPDPRMDVINEPFTDAGTVRTNGPFAASYGATTTGLYDVYRDAATKARALWPELKLGVNEYGIIEWPNIPRQDALFAIAARFGPQSVTLADRGLLDFVGIQYHPDNDAGQPTVAELKACIKRFADIGVDVEFTEVGIPTANASQRWQNLFDGAVTGVSRITIWGPTDAQSDVSGGSGSMPYNGDLTSKSYAVYFENWRNQPGTSAGTKIVIAKSSDGTGVNVTSVPVGTSTVKVAELDNITNPTVVNYYSVPVATATAVGYKYVPHAGTPVVDMAAVDASGVDIPPPPADPWGGRKVTSVVNTPGVSANNTTVPPAPTIVDTAGATWKLVSVTGSGNVAYRNDIATNSSNVTQLLFKDNVVYQVNTSGDWWKWQDNSTLPNPWLATTNPTGTTTTPPVTPPPTGGGSTAGQIIGLGYNSGYGLGVFDSLVADGIGYFRVEDDRNGSTLSYLQGKGWINRAWCYIGFGSGIFSDPASYAADAKSKVQTYGLTRWEVLNEPEYLDGSVAARKNYVEMCKATKAALAGTGCKVLGSLQPNGNFGRDVLAYGIAPYIDEGVIHPYGGGAGYDRAQSAAGFRAKVTDAFAALGKKIAITECGWPTAITQPATGDSQQWTEAEQAANIANFCDWVRANPQMISGFMYFGYDDYSPNNYYGIVRTKGDGGKKPAYFTLAGYAND
jgi:GH35 family endo-1,4-beta-xylanase